MKFKNWINQYIPLIESKPEYIVACRDNRLSREEHALLQRKISAFPRVYCEIGSGSGQHLINRATDDPHSLFAGLELRFKRTFKTAEKAERLALKNVLVIRHDARKIGELFPAESLDGVYINFPDPWSDKKRWSKHKLFSAAFIGALHPLMKRGAFISYKTDHPGCFEENRAILGQSGLFEETASSNDLHGSRYQVSNVETEFERLFISQGLPIHFLETRKR